MKRAASCNKAAPAEKAQRVESEWCEHGTLHVCDYGSQPSKTIAAFDLDDTLIATKSGATFAKNAADWRWWHPKVPEKLREFAAKGYRLVVLSNQSGISKGTTDKSTHRTKVDAVQKELGLPLLVLVATADDLYRKPRTGMWSWLATPQGGGIVPDINQCFFAGDAAGRLAVKKPKIAKDFSDSDLKFALNVRMNFRVPEQCFLGAGDDPTRLILKDFPFDPRQLGKQMQTLTSLTAAESQELIVVTGSPGSGKSRLATTIFKDYARVNQDTLKTKDKCLQVCGTALDDGKSAIVDNQNKDKATRKLYIDLAKKKGVPVRSILMDYSKDMCFHLNAYRSLNDTNPEHRGRDRVPSIVIHTYFKTVERPKKDEGFSDVIVCGDAQFEPRGSSYDIELLKSFILGA